MQHAVVGTDIQRRRASLVGGLERAVAGVEHICEPRLRGTHGRDLGVDNVSEAVTDQSRTGGRGAYPVSRAFIGCVAAQEVQIVGAVVACDIAGVQKHLLIVAEIAQPEGHASSTAGA
ncbi:hypothetical protein SDC9_146375 [bioreactor metagenome]|uniref:Uncharacterized protein n=1 Tax=bioreactor metagenome TaxID=1076179 RepID=A0A645EAU7_9ZZZZ